ncbi:MAG: ABC transporter substrate-binding protein [Anaerovoracaceae bacterium]
MNKKVMLVLILIVTMILASSCSLGVKEGKSEIIDSKTFIDDEGEKFEIKKPYEKIVSLYSAHTENLYALGEGDRLVGAHKTSIYPPAAAKLPRFDYKADPEPLIALNPDLVIIRPFIDRNYPDYIKALKKAGLKVVSLYPETNNDFEKYVRILGMLTGSEDKAIAEIKKQEKRIEEIHNKVKDIKEDDKITAYFESTKTDYRTVTPESNPGKAIVTAGGINLAADAKPIENGSTIASFGVEKIMEHAEDIDVYVSQRGAMNSGGSIISIPQREGFKSIKAVKEGKILELNEKIISSPTFRYYKGVNEMARAFYPEIMDDYSDLKSDKPINREDYAILTVKFDHSPIFIPASSHYYETDYYNHTYGMFEDIDWQYKNFDFIETAAMKTFVKGEEKNGKEFFNKEKLITREEVADTMYIMSDVSTAKTHKNIGDIGQCKNGTIVQKVVDNGLMDLQNGNFNPKATITANEVIKILENFKAKFK